MERLQKIIAARGLCSRRQAEKWIEEGRVRVNGNTAHLGDTADITEDVIEVDGKRLPKAGKKLYLMLNKPRGYVTTLSDEKGRKNAAELVAGCGARVYPVGRLDMDSEGLLLLTSDGGIINRVLRAAGGLIAKLQHVLGLHGGVQAELRPQTGGKIHRQSP